MLVFYFPVKAGKRLQLAFIYSSFFYLPYYTVWVVFFFWMNEHITLFIVRNRGAHVCVVFMCFEERNWMEISSVACDWFSSDENQKFVYLRNVVYMHHF